MSRNKLFIFLRLSKFSYYINIIGDEAKFWHELLNKPVKRPV